MRIVFLIFFLLIINSSIGQILIEEISPKDCNLLDVALLRRAMDNKYDHKTIEMFSENDKLLDSDLDRKIIAVKRIDIRWDSIQNKITKRILSDEIYIFRSRRPFTNPYTDNLFCYILKAENDPYFVVRKKESFPALSCFIDPQLMVLRGDIECVFVVSLFPNHKQMRGLFHDDGYNIFYYKEKESKSGYYVNYGQNASDSLKSCLEYEFGSVENYIETYKLRQQRLAPTQDDPLKGHLP